METEQEIILKREELKERLSKSLEIGEESYNYDSNKINWDYSGESYTWEEAKRNALNLMGKSDNRLIFVAHSKDQIIGKPQLIENVKRKIVLLRKIKKLIKKSFMIDGKRHYEEAEVYSYKFVGDLYDKRYDGVEIKLLALDFWIYRIISDDDKEYFVLSEQQLPNENCTINGMSISLDDNTEMTKSMKLKSLSNVFILKDFEPAVKIITKEQMINLTKNKSITEQDWFNILDAHQNGNLNRFLPRTELLRSSFILSGKKDGYPLHLFIMGVAGTRKSMGWIETLAYKLSDEPNICEGGNSRIKGLSPSFKEKPANIGILAKANRIAFIDEIGKMVELETKKHQEQTGNYLGDLNFLLEHKLRLVGSGNDNECRVQANAKNLFVTNPISNKRTIQDHIGVLDPTFMSRTLIAVQDWEETEFLLSNDSIIPPTHIQEVCNKNKKNYQYEKLLGGLYGCGGKPNINRNEFLTLFDTCYNFVCDIDSQRIKELVDLSVNLAKEPMKSSVWKPRASHHIFLLVDGICKHRCLFRDYDSTFKANDLDYEQAKALIVSIVNSWNTNFDKNNWRDTLN